MVRYMLHFRGKAVRLGLGVVEAIGPFDNVGDAWAFYDQACNTWAIPLPSADLLSFIAPMGEAAQPSSACDPNERCEDCDCGARHD